MSVKTAGVGHFAIPTAAGAFDFDINPPIPPIFGREGLGGDDVPNPNRGWNKKEWQQRVKNNQDEVEKTLRSIYHELTTEEAPISVLAQVDEIVRPVAQEVKQDFPLVIDWSKMAKDFERYQKLTRLYYEEKALEDEEEIMVLSS